MASNDYFEPDLFLGQQHDWTDIIKSGETYVIDDADPLSNVFHGKLFDGIGYKDGLLVSFLVFEDVSRASNMRKHLDVLSASKLAKHRVAKTFCVSSLKVRSGVLTFGSMTFGSMELKGTQGTLFTPLEQPHPCLVIERVSKITFDQWIKSASNDEQLQFFRSLFSTVGCIHGAGMYFGNIRMGIRVLDNLPKFVFPALFEETKRDQGIKSDLKELQKMVERSTFPKVCDRDLFNKLCENFAHNVECKDISLRDGSYWITHCSLVYTPTDRFNIIKALWEYRSLNIDTFNNLIEDRYGMPAIPTDFLDRIKNAKTKRQCEILEERELRAQKRARKKGEIPPPAREFKEASKSAVSLKKVLSQGSYDQSSSVFTFMRDAYEHKPEKRQKWLDVEAMLYEVFPDAYAAIYDMIISRLYYHATDPEDHNLLPILPFLQAEDMPYHFEF